VGQPRGHFGGDFSRRWISSLSSAYHSANHGRQFREDAGLGRNRCDSDSGGSGQ
jgi:hypothetical protein